MFLLQLKLDQWRASSDDQRSCCGWDRVAEPYDDLFLTSSRLPQSLLAGWDLSLSQVNPLPSPCWSGAHHHRPQLREFLQNRLKLSQHGVQCLRGNNARVTLLGPRFILGCGWQISLIILFIQSSLGHIEFIPFHFILPFFRLKFFNGTPSVNALFFLDGMLV